MAKRFAAAIMMCAVMVLVAAVPLAMAHYVEKGPQGPNASAVTWEYVPPALGTWTGKITNNGLRSLVVDVYDNSTGAPESIMHQRIAFAKYNAYPSGPDVITNGVPMNPNGHKYEITVKPNGPRGSSCVIVDMFDTPPVAAFEAVVTHMSVAVDASGSTDNGAIVSYDWTFGDGGADSGVMATHTYAATGTYTVTLTIVDDTGNTVALSKDVTITDDPPVASFTFTVDVSSVSFVSTSTDDYGIVSYLWDFGDGLTSTEMNPVHIFATEPVPGPTPVASASVGGRAPANPYTVYGFVYLSNGVTPVPGAVVTITNQRTQKVITAPEPTSIEGFFSCNINEVAGDVAIGDTIVVSAAKDTLTGTGSGVIEVDPDTLPYLGVNVVLSGNVPVEHTYTVTLTVADELGQTSMASATVTVVW